MIKSIYEKIYEDSETIFKNENWLDSVFIETTHVPDDQTLEEWNRYLKQYLDETNCGILKTLLVISKPYKTHRITMETLDKLNTRYKYLIGRF
jgi:uncharacterized protein YecA (UPF0149 family)